MAVEQSGAEAAHQDDAPPGPEGKTEDTESDLDDLKRRFREALDRKRDAHASAEGAQGHRPGTRLARPRRQPPLVPPQERRLAPPVPPPDPAAGAAQPSAATGTARNQLRSSVR